MDKWRLVYRDKDGLVHRGDTKWTACGFYVSYSERFREVRTEAVTCLECLSRG